MRTETLSIILPTEMAEMVRQTVESGAFPSNSELVREALRVWQERTRRLEAIRAGLDAAAADTVRHGADEVRDHFDRLLNETDKTVRQ